MPTWSAEQYTLFADERTRPARDLLAAVPIDRASRVIDLGCGPGNSTALLKARFAGARIEGIDSSADMLDKARANLPGVGFSQADIAGWMPEADTDLVFANAVFHWLPDHPGHMRRILQELHAGAALAIQIPDNLGEPSHLAMADVSAMSEFSAARDAGETRDPVPLARDYLTRLEDVARLDIWRTIYHHRLDGPRAIVDWFKGSGLRPFLERLEAALHPAFLAAYLERVTAAYPPLPDGSVILPFPRLFVVAVRR